MLAHLSEFTVTETTFDYGFDASYGVWEIRVDTVRQIGYFAHETSSRHGWLYFRHSRLVDTSNGLPCEVKMGLQKAGFVVPD